MVRQRPRHQRQTGQRMRRRKMDVVPILRGAVSDAACRTYKTLWSARAPVGLLNGRASILFIFSPFFRRISHLMGHKERKERHPLLLLAATTSAAILISIDFDLDQSEIIDLSLLI